MRCISCSNRLVSSGQKSFRPRPARTSSTREAGALYAQPTNETSMTEAQAANPVADQFLDAVEDFNSRARALGYVEVENYYWYHTIELPGGLITPGLYDVRDAVPN